MDRHSDSYQRKQAALVALRKEVYEAYGGAFCQCCGESEMIFLTLDHTNNDGAAHRKEIQSSKGRRGADADFYRHLKADGFPKEYGLRVLCWNCNCGRQRNDGVCPHQEMKRTRAARVSLTDEDIEFIRSQRGRKGPRTSSDKRWTLHDLSNKYGLSAATLFKIQQGIRTEFAPSSGE